MVLMIYFTPLGILSYFFLCVTLFQQMYDHRIRTGYPQRDVVYPAMKCDCDLFLAYKIVALVSFLLKLLH